MNRTERILASIAGLAVLIVVAKITTAPPVLVFGIGVGYGHLAVRWVMQR
jgi:hypothetical protein